jgi:hypothetical protein
MAPPRVNNSTIKDLNDSEMDEISSNDFKITIRMINKIKEDIYTLMKSKKIKNKQLN